ncbi:MAG TPA: zinc ribbon domain-containing protein [Candidatus Dormibacteraeota bacterium]|jgi:hypothetical protein|nr:zinc ribbon domain-containing protein [Candidatus Dormibacteraeota bacterium]
MALTCPFCGSENQHDGTQFCEACGHSLADVRPGQDYRPPVWTPPPPPAPEARTSWESLYATPAAQARAPRPPITPPRRRPTRLLKGLAAAAMVIVVAAVIGGVLVYRSRQPLIPNGKAVSTKTFSVTVPKSWTVDERQKDLIDFYAGDGSFYVSSDHKINKSDTPGSILLDIRKEDEQQYGTTSVCRAEQTMTVQGKQGEMEGFKYTVQFNDGSKEVHCSMIWIAVSGGNYYEVAFTSTTSLISQFYSQTDQKVVPSLVWKL